MVSQVSKSQDTQASWEEEEGEGGGGRVAFHDQGLAGKKGATYSGGKPIDQAADETSIAVHVCAPKR